MPDAEAKISKKLSQKSDWRDWFRDTEAEATRLGLLQNFRNGLNNVAPNVPANRQQHWRNLWKAILDSCKGSAESFLKDHDTNNMNAGQLVRCLRDQGQFNQHNLTHQKMADKGLEGIKFNNRDQPADVETFLSNLRDKMRNMPQIYPVNNLLPMADNLNEHILGKLKDFFSKGFHATIDRLEEEEPVPTFQEISNKMAKRLTSLIQEGTYKIENPSFGKAFPAFATEEEGSALVSSGVANKRKSQNDEDDSDDEEGTVKLTAKALKRLKQKERKKAIKQVNNNAFASNGKSSWSSNNNKNNGGKNNKNNKGKGKKNYNNKNWNNNSKGGWNNNNWNNNWHNQQQGGFQWVPQQVPFYTPMQFGPQWQVPNLPQGGAQSHGQS